MINTKCSKCGTENPTNAVYCQKCGKLLQCKNGFWNSSLGKLIYKVAPGLTTSWIMTEEPIETQDKYKTAAGLGLIGIFFGLIISSLFLILGIASGIYLWTRPEESAKQKGKYVVGGCVLVLVLIFGISLFKALS